MDMNARRTERSRSRELVLCPICDIRFNAKTPGALVLTSKGGGMGMDIIRCPKCLRREWTPNDPAH